MNELLSEELLSAIGRTAPPCRELVTRRDIRKYAIATGNRQRKYLDGDQAPPMFHVALFWDVVELDQLSPDGVSIDRLLPKFPLEKAMAGGLLIETTCGGTVSAMTVMRVSSEIGSDVSRALLR